MLSEIQAKYDVWAAQYDHETNKTVEVAALAIRRRFSGERLGSALDIGCGTGRNTTYLCAIADHVLGLDFSEGMLLVAQRRSSDAVFRQADVTQAWPVADKAYDLVVSSLVLQHVPDLVGIYAEATRVLRPAGRFMVCEFHPVRVARGGAAWYRLGSAVTIPGFLHTSDDHKAAASASGLRLVEASEHAHHEDTEPRITVSMYQKDNSDAE